MSAQPRMSRAEEGVPGEGETHQVGDLLVRTRSPRAIQALEQASAEARKKGEALQETAAQEEFVQHLQRDIDAVQREIDTATPRPDAMLAQSRLQNALDRELALRQRCATLSEELAEAKSELETAQQHTAMLRQEQLEQRQRKEEPVASTKPEEEGHGGNDGRVQAEDEVEETQRQQEEAQGDGAGDDDVDEDKSDQVHKRRSRGAASEQAPGKQELSTLDKGSGSIDATISMHQNSNSNGGGGGGGGSGGRRRRLRLRLRSSSSSSSSGSGSGSGATSSGSDDSDDVDSSNGSDGHALPPAEYFNVALVVNASVRRVRMEISNRGLSVASGREGLAGGVQDIFCYSWAQVSNWSLYKSGTKSGTLHRSICCCVRYKALPRSFLAQSLPWSMYVYAQALCLPSQKWDRMTFVPRRQTKSLRLRCGRSISFLLHGTLSQPGWRTIRQSNTLCCSE